MLISSWPRAALHVPLHRSVPKGADIQTLTLSVCHLYIVHLENHNPPPNSNVRIEPQRKLEAQGQGDMDRIG
jgi:hypothetical protein